MKKLSKKLVIPSFFHKNFLKLFLYTKRKLIFNINFFFLFYKAPPTNLLYIKKTYAATMLWHCSFSVFALFIQQWKFGEALCLFFFFLKFRILATVLGGTVATVVTIFFCLLFVLFFFIYIFLLTQQISQLLKCQFLISQDKIIKYEVVTNHN